MPNFKTLEYKNLQSVGNHPIKIQLDRSPTTLIGGPNGSGKSTLLYAFTYCLYGKFPSGAKLVDAINSVNKKNLLVKVGFTERGDDYLVVRGEKPKIFEIYRNGELLDQHAHSRDQQKFLELILGMDYKLFTQIVMLNKERFVPFMEMSVGDRRKVIEDILDISIFSEMNEIVKTKLKENQQEQANLEKQLEVKRTKLEGQRKLIQQLQEVEAAKKSSSQQLINDKQLEFEKISRELDELRSKYDLLSTEGHEQVKKQKKEFESLAIQFEQKIANSKEHLKFFSDNDHCPTCGQDISDELKQKKQHECNEQIAEVQNVVAEMLGELDKILKRDKEFKAISVQKKELESDIKIKISSKTYVKNELDKLISESQVDSNDSKLQEHINTYHEIESSIETTRETLEQTIEQYEQYDLLR